MHRHKVRQNTYLGRYHHSIMVKDREWFLFAV